VIIEAETYDDLQREVMGYLHLTPEYITNAVKESLFVTLRLRDPRARTSNSPVRATDYAPAVTKFLSVFNGTQGIIDAKSVAALIADQNARDVVVKTPSADLQFIIRGNRLHMHASVPAADAVWTLTDKVFMLTLLQEMMLLDLQDHYTTLGMGEFVLTVGSLYLYEKHYNLAALLSVEEPRPPVRMPPIADREDLLELAQDAKALREGGLIGMGGYGGGALWMFDKLLTYRLAQDTEVKWPGYRQAAAA
jgi:hypothetical protein